MANENLKNAIQNAGLSVEQLAQAIHVDPKSVKRWVDGATTPYPRHRGAIARALNVSEPELWPDRYPPPTMPGASPADTPASAAAGLVGCWGAASQPTAPDPAALITTSDGPIDLLNPSPGTWPEAALAQAVSAQAATGRAIRILTETTDAASGPSPDDPRIQRRATEHTLAYGLLRVGNTILLALPLSGEPGQPPALIQLINDANGSLFDRLARNYQTLWQTASPPTPAQPALQPTSASSANDGHSRDPPRHWPRRAP